MKKLQIVSAFAVSVLLFACGGDKKSESTGAGETPAEAPKSMVNTSEYDPNRGEGKWTAENVNVGATLDAAKADAGQKISDVKCTSCHKMTDEKLVGPGWKGVMSRHKPEWIMNFITNPDPMITKDPKMQAQLEICLVRMPNQNLTDDEARNVLEYMRKVDGVK